VTVDIRGRTTGSQRLRVRIRLTGSSDGGGGLAISDGTITVGTDAMPADFSGPLGGVEDGRLVATLTDAAGSRVQVVVDVRVGRSDRATGHILFRSVGANGGGA
jgi:hypothetical protein